MPDRDWATATLGRALIDYYLMSPLRCATAVLVAAFPGATVDVT